MSVDYSVFTQGTIGTLLIEGVKYLWRKFVVKDLAYEFHPNFYTIGVPVANVVALLFLALLGVPGYSLPVDLVAWQEYLRLLVLTAVSSVISVVVYNSGLRQAKNYAQTFIFKK